MNKLKYLLIMIIEGIVYYLIIIKNITIPCLFKSIIKIPCPSCGLTRSFKSILDLKLLDAIKYNILSIPLFIILIIINILLIIDIIKNNNITIKFLKKILKHYKLIIILLLITEIINIYHHV